MQDRRWTCRSARTGSRPSTCSPRPPRTTSCRRSRSARPPWPRDPHVELTNGDRLAGSTLPRDQGLLNTIWPGGRVDFVGDQTKIFELDLPFLDFPLGLSRNFAALLIAMAWRHIGYVMVLYLAGLKSVDNSLREAFGDILGAPMARQRGYFEPAFVSRLVKEHLSGQRDHTSRLWQLTVFELWHRQYLDKAAVGSAAAHVV